MCYDWETNSIQWNSYLRTVNRLFLDKINDIGLHQANHEPTRGEAILDMFLTNRPSLITKITVIPRLDDHDINLTDSRLKAPNVKQTPRTISIWKKANSEAIIEDTKSFISTLLLSDNDETAVEQTWQSIQDHLSLVMENIFLSVLLEVSPALHRNNLKRTFNKNTMPERWQRAQKRKKDWDKYNYHKRETRRANRQAVRK